MFRQYQHQESAGSLSAVRTISGASQSSETMECVNGPSAEETAPSTVIELTVADSARKSPDCATDANITSSPFEAGDTREHTHITVSNILQDEQRLVQESSTGNGNKSEASVSQTNNINGQSDANTVTGTSDEKTDNQQELVSNLPETCVTPDAQAPSTDEQQSVHNEEESSHSMTDDPLNGAELPLVPEEESQNEQMSPEVADCLENSALGGASVFNEDLVDVSSVSDPIQPSDADDSQEESSYASAAAGDEGNITVEEGTPHEDESKENHGLTKEEGKDEGENGEAAAGVCSQDGKSSAAETPDDNLTEPPKEVGDEKSEPAADQPRDSTLPSADHEVALASPDTPVEETPSNVPDSSAAATRSDSQRSTDSKTKEIKIARLDVSNVALDTERLELKEASATVRSSPITVYTSCTLCTRQQNMIVM